VLKTFSILIATQLLISCGTPVPEEASNAVITQRAPPPAPASELEPEDRTTYMAIGQEAMRRFEPLYIKRDGSTMSLEEMERLARRLPDSVEALAAREMSCGVGVYDDLRSGSIVSGYGAADQMASCLRTFLRSTPPRGLEGIRVHLLDKGPQEEGTNPPA
jgi:hypothetical protein